MRRAAGQPARRIAGALLLGVGLLAVSPGVAEPLDRAFFDSFLNVCLANVDDLGAVERIAEAQGWELLSVDASDREVTKTWLADETTTLERRIEFSRPKGAPGPPGADWCSVESQLVYPSKIAEFLGEHFDVEEPEVAAYYHGLIRSGWHKVWFEQDEPPRHAVAMIVLVPKRYEDGLTSTTLALTVGYGGA